MDKMLAQWKATQIMLRIYWICALAIPTLSFLVNLIVRLAAGPGDNTDVSLANLIVIFLIIAPIVVPAGTFAKVIHLGATRWEFYKGAVFYYATWAAMLSAVNVLWLQFEIRVYHHYMATFNILDIFHWDQFGFIGCFLYQFVVYMLVMSLFHLLFSGIRSFAGWVLMAVFVAAIPITTSIAPLRQHLAEILRTLLLNDVLWRGIVWNLAIAAVFLYGGWLFTRRRIL